MPEFAIRLEEGEADRAFIRALNGRLSDVIEAPTHSRDEVVAFQDRFTASAWEADARPHATLVAVSNDGRRLGYVHVREGADEIGNEKCAYIALLAVVAEAEGKGVGLALLHAAETWAKDVGYRRLSLDVFASNHHARHFYEKAGFRPETIRLIRQL